MKCIVIFLIALTPLVSWPAKNNDILKCLGQEEKRIHLSKDSGPVYDLNQKLISEMIQIPNVNIRQNFYRQICENKQFSESWKLLEYSIVEGKNLFTIPEKIQGMQRQMTIGMIEDYIEATRDTLVNFIGQIQTISPTPNCLKEEIPELNTFFTEIKYLQEDVDLKQIFKGKDQKIFKQLKNYPSAFEKCRGRLKKKDNSGSTSPRKR